MSLASRSGRRLGQSDRRMQPLQHREVSAQCPFFSDVSCSPSILGRSCARTLPVGTVGTMSADIDPWRFQRWAFNTSTGSVGRKAVLVALAVMADVNTGRCEARQDTLAQQVEADARTVRRHLRDLEGAGLIARRHQYRIDHKRRNDEFLLLAPWVEAWPDGMPVPKHTATGQSDPYRTESARPTGQNQPDLPDRIDPSYRTPVSAQEQPLKNDHLRTTKPPDPLSVDFEDWIAHHIAVTDNRAMTKAGTQAHARVLSAYKARRAEYPDEDLRLVSVGAMADDYRRENGYTDAESVLRPSAVPKLLERGAQVPVDANPRVVSRLEEVRANVSSGGFFEPARAAKARDDLEAMGFEIIELEKAPWVQLRRVKRETQTGVGSA
jgi:hypothetical protein